MATKTTEPRNWTYLAGKTVTAGFAVGALAASYTHIVHLFQGMGLEGWQAWTSPAFIDGFAILGLIGRSKSMSASTRRKGFWIQAVATLASLTANVLSGDSLGGAIFGAMVVIGYAVAEWYSHSMQAAPTKTEVTATARSAAAQKAAATRAANKAAAEAKSKAAAARKANAKAIRDAERKTVAELTCGVADRATYL